MINLDKAALNSPHPRFEQSISRAIEMHRPSSNPIGILAKNFVYDCKSRIAGHIGREALDISCFGSATAAIEFVSKKLKSEYSACFLVPETEHSCSLNVASYEIAVDEHGQAAGIVASLSNDPHQDVIIISLKNNETGITPSSRVREELADAQSLGARLVIDATGGDWNDSLVKNADYVFASSGKWHGLPGLGILAGSKDLWDEQLTEGLGGVIGGSPNTVAISCLADAMDWMCSPYGIARKELVSTYGDVLDEAAAHLGWTKNGSGRGIANYYTGLPSDLFLSLAGERGLNISAGSACNSGIDKSSHVIGAMYSPERAARSLRFSWDLLTKESDILAAVEIVKSVDSMLRAHMPNGDKK